MDKPFKYKRNLRKIVSSGSDNNLLKFNKKNFKFNNSNSSKSHEKINRIFQN